MDFAFNFELTDGDACEDQQEERLTVSSCPLQDQGQSRSENKKDVFSSYEVTSFHKEHILSKLQTKTVNLIDNQLKIVDTNTLEQLILTDTDFKDAVDDSNLLSNIISHSDLAEGIYEGGLKIWECSIDLANYISSDSKPLLQIQGKKVLEVGCGAGIPGVYCVMSNAARVDFQDYNAEVLQLLTQPNVTKNMTKMATEQTNSSMAKSQCHFYAGDWSSFVELESLANVKYDLILSAETIYNVANYAKLHKVFDNLLTNNGLIIIAAKSHYFGVGGSVEAFMEYVGSQQCFSVEIVQTSTKGVLRKILWLERQRDEVQSSNIDVK